MMADRTRRFDYPSLDAAFQPAALLGSVSADGGEKSGREQQLAAELRAIKAASVRQVEDARRQGRETALREMQDRSTHETEAVRERVAAAMREFDDAQQDYFRRLEQDVVQLALAVAKKVLHREVQMDALLLSGAVRVALERLKDCSGVTLCVPDAEAALWREFCATQGVAVEVKTDAALATGACRLETHVGTVELGVEAQLVEIEKGFFDLLDRRAVAQRSLESEAQR